MMRPIRPLVHVLFVENLGGHRVKSDRGDGVVEVAIDGQRLCLAPDGDTLTLGTCEVILACAALASASIVTTHLSITGMKDKPRALSKAPRILGKQPKPHVHDRGGAEVVEKTRHFSSMSMAARPCVHV